MGVLGNGQEDVKKSGLKGGTYPYPDFQVCTPIDSNINVCFLIEVKIQVKTTLGYLYEVSTKVIYCRQNTYKLKLVPVFNIAIFGKFLLVWS